jgi:hypothetical protein
MQQPPNMSTPAPISIFSLSQSRVVVRTIHEYINPHDYGIGGILESDPFSKSELALALRVLDHPPPRSSAETRKVFSQSLSEVGLEKG